MSGRFGHGPNGRVNILPQPDLNKQFSMMERVPAKQCASMLEPTIGIWDDTPLSKLFFSARNMRILQNSMRHEVWQRTHSVLGEQDCQTLDVIMRGIFLQASKNLPDNITAQIEALNRLVLNYCVPQLVSAVQSQRQFIEDTSWLPPPISLPVLAKNTDKQLIMRPFF